MTRLPDTTDVLIVGAGPTGLMLAVELARRGIDHLLVDQAEGSSTFIKGSVVTSRTLEIFEELGLFEQAMELGQVVHSVVLWAEGERALTGDMGLLEASHAFNLHLGQPYTEQLLSERLAKDGGSVCWQTKLIDFQDDGRQIDAQIERLDGQQLVRAKWIVGCDGAHSRVRGKLGFRLQGRTYPVDYILANCRLDWNQPGDALHLFFTREGSFTVNPLPDGLIQVAADLPHQEGDGRTKRVPFLEDVQMLFDRRVAIPGRLYEPRRMVYYRAHRRQVSQRLLGRSILAGDAAHLVSPQTGLGMNTGLQDSWNLGWKLAAIVRESAEPSLLASYDEERQAILRPLGKLSDRNEMVYTLRSRVVQELRDHVMVAAMHFEPLWRRNMLEVTQMQVNYRGLSQFDEQVAKPIHLPGRHVVASGQCTRAWLAFGRGPAAGDRVPDARPVMRSNRIPGRLLPFSRGGRHVLLLFTGVFEPVGSVCRALSDCVDAARDRLGDQVHLELVVPADRLSAVCSAIDVDSVVFDFEQATHQRFGARSECLYFCRCDGFVGFRSLPPVAKAFVDWLDATKFGDG